MSQHDEGKGGAEWTCYICGEGGKALWTPTHRGCAFVAKEARATPPAPARTYEQGVEDMRKAAVKAVDECEENSCGYCADAIRALQVKGGE